MLENSVDALFESRVWKDDSFQPLQWLVSLFQLLIIFNNFSAEIYGLNVVAGNILNL